MNKLDMESKDIVNENIEKISELFPNVIVESEKGKSIDFDLLKQELSKEIVEGNKEKYQLTWPGKKEAILNANTPCNKTLRPVKEKSVDFENTKNIYIEGDNLEALKILQESYLGKIKCIYIDPPYNTGSDLIYNDSFKQDIQEELNFSGQIDEENNKLVTNVQTNGRFHSDWMSMIYPRLKIARNLLSEDGIIFISIDDNEEGNLKRICDEIFGDNNFIGILPRITKKSGKSHSETVAKNHDYILIYTKRNDIVSFNGIDFSDSGFSNEDEYINERGKYKLNQTLDYDSLWYNPTMDFPLEIDGRTFVPGGDEKKHQDRHNGIHKSKDWVWRWSRQKFEFGYNNGFVVIKAGKDRPRIYTKTYEKATIGKNDTEYFIDYLDRKNNISSLEFTDNKYSNDNAKKELSRLDMGADFDFSKPSSLILKILEIINPNKEFYALDFFSGSGTMADAVMQFNVNNQNICRSILVQIPEKVDSDYQNICNIGEERIRRAAKRIKEETNADIDYGFRVYKVDFSNMKDVYYVPNEIKQSQLGIFESNIKNGRTSEDLLTQVILDLGLTLDLKIEEKDVLTNKVYFVDENSLIACFDNEININTVDEICKYKPLKVVFKDESFKYDNDKINLQERFKKLSPNTEVNIL